MKTSANGNQPEEAAQAYAVEFDLEEDSGVHALSFRLTLDDMVYRVLRVTATKQGLIIVRLAGFKTLYSKISSIMMNLHLALTLATIGVDLDGGFNNDVDKLAAVADAMMVTFSKE